MSVIKPSILDRVKATLQSVFARHQPSDVHTGPERPNTSTAAVPAPEAVPTPTVDVGSGPSSLLWLTTTQRDILQQMERGTTTERRLIDRARILLRFDPLRSKKRGARALHIDIKTVRTWHERWDDVRSVLSPLEIDAVPCQAYRRVVEEALKDAPRSGSPVTFTAEQVAQIVAMACEQLDDSDGPISHWTTGHLAAEAGERNIVDSISRASVGRFLGEAQIKPHLTKGWLNSPERDTPEFTEAAQSVCDVYQQALERHAQESIC